MLGTSSPWAPSLAAPPPGPAGQSRVGREDADLHEGPRAAHKTAFRVSSKAQFNVFSNKTKGSHLVPFMKTSSGSKIKRRVSWVCGYFRTGVAWTQSLWCGNRAAGSRCCPGFCFCFTEAELRGWGAGSRRLWAVPVLWP